MPERKNPDRPYSYAYPTYPQETGSAPTSTQYLTDTLKQIYTHLIDINFNHFLNKVQE